MAKHVVAVDPGISIGLAVKLGEEYRTATLMKPTDLDDFIMGAGVVIIEQFMIFGGRRTGRISRYGLQTTEIVGYVTAMARQVGAELVRHAPVNRTAFIKKAKQIVLPGGTIHEVDALAHLLAWEYQQGVRK